MQWLGEMATAVGHSLAGLALATVCYGVLERMRLRPAPKSVLVGLVFGLTGCLMMAAPMPLADGVIMDGRYLGVGLAGAFGGLPALIVSLSITGLFRVHLGGQGATIGILSTVFAGVVGALWRRFVMRKSAPDGASMALFGAVLSSHALSIAFLPVPDAAMLMVKTWALLLPLYVIASTLYGLMMLRETFLIANEEKLNALSTSDHLTRLPNRRRFEKHLDGASRRERDGGDGYSVLLIDIDHFKTVNDTFGHEAGDDALRAVAEVLARHVSGYDLPCRYGGEEFAVFLLYSSPSQAADKAEKIRRRIEALDLNCAGRAFGITVSIGISSSFGLDQSPATIMKAADKALYSAKTSGRNKVVSTDSADEPAPPTRRRFAAAA